MPHLVHAFAANLSVFVASKSAPKRVSTAVRDTRLPPAPPALPVAPLHPRPDKSPVVVRKKISQKWCWLAELLNAQGCRGSDNEREMYLGVGVLECDYEQVSQVTCKDHVE